MPQDCFYTEKLNMSWDVPKHSGQLAHRARIQSTVRICWKWSWDIIIPECTWDLFGHVLFGTDQKSAKECTEA